MKRLLTIISVIGISIYMTSCKSYSFKQSDTKILITPDSLGYIYILPNKQFGFMSHNGQSPFSDKHKVYDSWCGVRSYAINEQGSGKYILKKNKLLLKFTEPKSIIDSIYYKSLKPKTLRDSIKIKVIFKSYAGYGAEEGIGMSSKITSKNDVVNYDTRFDDFANLTISKTDLPLELIINGNYKFLIKDKIDQEIELFINEFKKFSDKDIKDKIYSTNTLIYQEN
ncbi:hypothetical protein [Psychroserpens luteus]|uniref:Lipoprotein n=1 Tax=Psychroserpens luteus TaxID=1434066 RepID=A0ABW5ZNA5_9FLAO|nr:hypothetical protein [Psychroserpens luteus]